MRVDVGERDAKPLDNTEFLAATAQEKLAWLIQDLVGTRFFGKAGVMLVFQAGQITEVQPMVEQRIR